MFHLYLLLGNIGSIRWCEEGSHLTVSHFSAFSFSTHKHIIWFFFNITKCQVLWFLTVCLKKHCRNQQTVIPTAVCNNFKNTFNWFEIAIMWCMTMAYSFNLFYLIWAILNRGLTNRRLLYIHELLSFEQVVWRKNVMQGNNDQSQNWSKLLIHWCIMIICCAAALLNVCFPHILFRTYIFKL